MRAGWAKEGRGRYALFRGRTKLGYVESDDSKWVAVIVGWAHLNQLFDTADFKTRREAEAWVETRVAAAPAHSVT